MVGAEQYDPKNSSAEIVRYSQSRRGLVLEGGGAKGAWQFGVLEALAESGVEFDAVSGTSVGALNGAIWSAGKMQIGRELWWNMSRARVFKLRWLLIAVVFFTTVCRFYYIFFQGYVLKSGRVGRVLSVTFSLLTAMAPLSTWWHFFGDKLSDWTTWLFLSFMLFYIWYIVVRPAEDESDAAERRTLAINSSLYPWAIVAVDPFYEFFVEGDPSAFGDKVIWIGGLPLYLLGLAWLTRHMNISVFSAAPLGRTIKDVLSTPLLRPLFATTGRESGDYFDPDNLSYVPVRDVQGTDISYYQPVPRNALLPNYLRVDRLDADSACEALLATSALPLGVVQSRLSADGGRLIDGGSIDNVPWYPLVDDLPWDEIIIVSCNPAPPWNDEAAKAVWMATNRLARVVELNLKPAISKNDESVYKDPPQTVPLVRPSHWPTRITIIAPETPLGNFFTGTLNFSNTAARRQLAEGRAAGLQKVHAILG